MIPVTTDLATKELITNRLAAELIGVLRAVVAAVKLVSWGVLLVGAVSLSIGTGVPALDASVDEIVADAQATIDALDLPTLPAVSGDVSPSGGQKPAAGNHTDYERAIAREIHDRINGVRAERGLDTLTYSEKLATIGRYHSDDMAAKGYFAHTGPDGQSLTDRYDRFGYDCRATIDTFKYATGGENIYKSVASKRRPVDEVASEAVQGWLDSKSHRKNLLKPYWDREGLGVNVTQDDGKTTIYVTQNFC